MRAVRVPTREELLAVIDGMITDARQAGETERMNMLLDKRARVDDELAFLNIVLRAR